MRDLISPSDARRLIASHCHQLKNIKLPIEDALGDIAAETVRSSISLPTFDNSAMDGFAYRAEDTSKAAGGAPARLHIAGVVYAGDPPPKQLGANTVFRIMTGAPLPRGADTVIAQEYAVVDGDSLVFEDTMTVGRHVRERGEEIEKGAVVVSTGQRIHPGVVGALASVGCEAIRVIRRPTAYLITTGDETVKLGQQLRAGQIYNSNAPMLRAALADMGVDYESRHVADNPRTLASATRTALKTSDVVIFVGGVSVGEKDYLRSVLAKQGVEEVFWRVRQKPGKPLYFGVQGKRLVFGLPGNPASAFTCFYAYVYSALRQLAGVEPPELQAVFREIDDEVAADAKKTRYLKARTSRISTEPLGQQGSHMITALVKTNSLAVVPPGDDAAAGDKLETMILPYAEEGSE